MLLLGACADEPAVETTLAVLVEYQHNFDGRRVRVAGVLRTFPKPRHHWIEDEALNRVALEGVDDLNERLGQRLGVEGRFAYDPDQGRRILVDRLFDP